MNYTVIRDIPEQLTEKDLGSEERTLWGGGGLNTAKKTNKHSIATRKVNETQSPQRVLLAPFFHRKKLPSAQSIICFTNSFLIGQKGTVNFRNQRL